MPDHEEDGSAVDNQEVVGSLRDAFAPITARLRPDVESATVYLLYVPLSKSDPSAEDAE